MAEWKSSAHLDDHYGRHRGRDRVRSVEEYDASAQETIALGVRFTYRDILTNEPRVGYFHRDSSRLTATTVDGLIVTHHLTDEERVASLPRSTYRDDEGTMTMMDTTAQQSDSNTAPASDPLDEVFRRLVGIHASLAESLSTDPKVVPWAEREIDDVLRYIHTVRKGSTRASVRGR